MRLVVFGLSVTSTWGNGHGTTFRALLSALHERGHEITFFEKDVEWYASNRDLPEPEFCRVRLYTDWSEALPDVRRQLKRADVAMVGSYFPDGVAAINEMADSPARVKVFYDIDTPITVAALYACGKTEYLESSQIPLFDIYFSFTGGPLLADIEHTFQARHTTPLYCSVDPQKYRRQGDNKRFACDLSYMGTYAPDRQPKVDELLCEPARRLRHAKFLVAGSQFPKQLGWPANVERILHLNSRWHPSFYSSSRFTLNVTRRDMVSAGYSPSVRLFEAAACGAAIISDNWPGLDEFFSPGEEILLPTTPEDVVYYLTELSEREIRNIGESAQARVLAAHSSGQRAVEFEVAVERALVRSHPRAFTETVTRF